MGGSRWVVAFIVAAAACGGSGSSPDGEPIDGTITLTYGTETVVPVVGAAIENTQSDMPQMLVILGTAGLDCETTLESSLLAGYYVGFTADRTQPGAYTQTVAVIHVADDIGDRNASTGSVVIETIDDDRVVGNLQMNTTDAEVGTIATSGTFDVIRCF